MKTRFQSVSEFQFSKLLTKQSRKWEYPAKRFDLGNTTYRPDFYLPKEKLYIELVGTRQAYSANKHKYELFKERYPKIKFFICDPSGKEFIPQVRFGETVSIKIWEGTYEMLVELKKKKGISICFIASQAVKEYVKRTCKRGERI